MATQQITVGRCVGKKNYHLSEKTNWYGLSGKSINEDTRCEYCKQHLDLLGVDYELYSLTSHDQLIDCDSILDVTLSGMKYNGFTFGITTPDGNAPFLVHPPKAMDRRQGLLVVEMPAVQDYSVQINPCFTAFDENRYFSFSMKVGNRDVVVNDNKPIFYRKKTSVHGFKTGTDQGFRFVATNQLNVPDTAEHTENKDSNVITINIKTFERERNAFHFGGQNPFGYESQPVYRGFDLRTNTFGSSTSETRPFNVLLQADQTESVIDGGRTDHSGRQVPSVNTSYTTDRFVETGSFSVTIQLVHVSSPSYQAVLMNSHYKQLNQLHSDSIAQITQRQQRQLAVQRELLMSTSTTLPQSTVHEVPQPLNVPQPLQTTVTSTEQPTIV